MRKIYIYTPFTNNAISVQYHWSVMRLVRDLHHVAKFDLLELAPLVGTKRMRGVIEEVWLRPSDLAVARARAVRKFLKTDGTHLLFIDSDIEFLPLAVAGLMQADVDFVGAPYPRKTHDPNEPMAFYTGQDDEPLVVGENGLVEVHGVGLGLVLLSRKCLSMMCDHYFDELWFKDQDSGGDPTVSLFLPFINEERLQGTEDYSFAQRWRKMGGKVQLYCGPGTPVAHVGTCVYRRSEGDMLKAG